MSDEFSDAQAIMGCPDPPSAGTDVAPAKPTIVELHLDWGDDDDTVYDLTIDGPLSEFPQRLERALLAFIALYPDGLPTDVFLDRSIYDALSSDCAADAPLTRCLAAEGLAFYDDPVQRVTVRCDAGCELEAGAITGNIAYYDALRDGVHPVITGEE